MAGGIGLSIVAYIYPPLYPALIIFLILLGVGALADLFLLFRKKEGILGERECVDRFSNGEDNPVRVNIYNNDRLSLRCRVIDEIPLQFQRRDISYRFRLGGKKEHHIDYTLRPVRRGVYSFGKLRVFVSSFLSIFERRYSFKLEKEIAVYPSFMMMRRYELMVLGNLHQESGGVRQRIIGGNTAFEHIKPYVVGDDPRTVNWKATAKLNRLMVNEYTEERAQQIYCITDTGRTMQSPFDGMTMLDHVINTTLTLSNIILKKGDRAGVITFSNKPGSWIKADSRSGQLNRISEALYKLETDFLETDFEILYKMMIRQVPTRSLCILFSNFDTVSGMRRHLPALRQLAKRHLLLLILFENSELVRALEQPVRSLKEIYFETTAASFQMEKYQMAAELARAGIRVILSKPEELTANTINSYLNIRSF